jgi:hypothetical protein
MDIQRNKQTDVLAKDMSISGTLFQDQAALNTRESTRMLSECQKDGMAVTWAVIAIQ